MKKVVVLLSVVVAAFGFVNAQESGAKMEFEYETYDYGTIMQDMEQKNGDTKFVFTNTGTEPLIIEKAKGSCGCTVPDAPLNQPIAPGESSEVKVHYNTSRVGAFNKKVTLTTNAGTHELFIKGKVEPKPVEETMPVNKTIEGATPVEE